YSAAAAQSPTQPPVPTGRGDNRLTHWLTYNLVGHVAHATAPTDDGVMIPPWYDNHRQYLVLRWEVVQVGWVLVAREYLEITATARFAPLNCPIDFGDDSPPKHAAHQRQLTDVDQLHLTLPPEVVVAKQTQWQTAVPALVP